MCGSSARTDLCGGCPETGIPTATHAVSRDGSCARSQSKPGGYTHALPRQPVRHRPPAVMPSKPPSTNSPDTKPGPVASSSTPGAGLSTFSITDPPEKPLKPALHPQNHANLALFTSPRPAPPCSPSPVGAALAPPVCQTPNHEPLSKLRHPPKKPNPISPTSKN